jgi:hypothetical protein
MYVWFCIYVFFEYVIKGLIRESRYTYCTPMELVDHEGRWVGVDVFDALRGLLGWECG